MGCSAQIFVPTCWHHLKLVLCWDHTDGQHLLPFGVDEDVLRPPQTALSEADAQQTEENILRATAWRDGFVSCEVSPTQRKNSVYHSIQHVDIHRIMELLPTKSFVERLPNSQLYKQILQLHPLAHRHVWQSRVKGPVSL